MSEPKFIEAEDLNNTTLKVEEKSLPKELTPEETYTLQQASTQNIITQTVPEFEYLINDLSNKQLRRVLKTLVRFPFLKDKFKFPSDEEKRVFMLGERIIQAKMVLYAREELKQTINTLDKMEENKDNKPEENLEKVDETLKGENNG